MSRLDWPDGWDRTPPKERSRTTKFQTTRGQTGGEIADEMRRLDVDDWRVSTASGGSYTKRNGLPKHDANPDDPGFVLRWRKETDADRLDMSVYETEPVETRGFKSGEGGHAQDEDQEWGYAVGCDAYASLDDNMRAVYLWVRETRLRSQRPVKTGSDEFAAARLPSADSETETQRPPPHQILGVVPDASDAVIRGAFRELVKKNHGDHGGAGDSIKDLQWARDQLLEEKG